MATNSRNGNKRVRNSTVNPKSNKKDLKLSAAQFWKIGALQSKWEVESKNALLVVKDAEILVLEKKILELNHKFKLQRANVLNASQKNLKKELDLYRIEVAQELGIKSLDPYLVDTDTFILKHEDEIKV